MSKCKDVKQCKSSNDFKGYAEKHPNCESVEEGKEHIKVITKKGHCALPRSGGKDLKTGTRFSIIKAFIVLGLGVFIFWIIGNNLGALLALVN